MIHIDCLREIFKHITCGSDFKSILFTSREFAQAAAEAHPTGRIKFANHLITLLKMFPRADWNWAAISRNPNITWEFISANPDNLWNWTFLSKHPCITWDIIQSEPSKSWSWANISRNPNITCKIVSNNSGWPWDWQGLASNPTIFLECVSFISNKGSDVDVSYVLSVFAFVDYSWDWRSLSYNPRVVREIFANPLNNWCVSKMNILNAFRTSGVTIDIISMYPIYNRGLYGALSHNPNITWEIISKNLHKPWDWTALSTHSNITWEIISANLNLPWDFFAISNNPNITRKIMQDNPEYPWENISSNTGLTWEDIMLDPEYDWDWGELSANSFNKRFMIGT